MTSRELAEKIDELVRIRILDASYSTMATKDAIEILKQKIADGLKRLDHEPGVYYGEPPIK